MNLPSMRASFEDKRFFKLKVNYGHGVSVEGCMRYLVLGVMAGVDWIVEFLDVFLTIFLGGILSGDF